VFLLVAVVVGTVFVRLNTPRVGVVRRVYPAQAHEGATIAIEVEVTAERRLRNFSVDDTVHGLGTARFAAAATPAVPAIARYEVHCRARGVFAVGPAEISLADPFGLSERRVRVGAADRLTVYPKVEPLIGLPAVRGLDPSQQSARPTFAPHGGEDFFTLREYQFGDDLRRVHWPSSARRDSLMIKQLEVPWQAHALVLLDVRREQYSLTGSFEQAVRGAASVIAHLHEGGFAPELWTTERAAPPRTGNRYDQAMDALAIVQTVAGLDHRRTVARLHRKGAGGGVLVLVTGEPDDGALGAFRVLSRSFGRTIALIVSDRGTEAGTPFGRFGAVTVVARPGGAWGPGWRTAVEMSWSTASAG
jgi:uncharacterized protein (DUF58 family)